MALLGLPAAAGLPQGGLPGFEISSSAESNAGPISAGGLTFAARDSNSTLLVALGIVALTFVAVAYFKGR